MFRSETKIISYNPVYELFSYLPDLYKKYKLNQEALSLKLS